MKFILLATILVALVLSNAAILSSKDYRTLLQEMERAYKHQIRDTLPVPDLEFEDANLLESNSNSEDRDGSWWQNERSHKGHHHGGKGHFKASWELNGGGSSSSSSSSESSEENQGPENEFPTTTTTRYTPTQTTAGTTMTEATTTAATTPWTTTTYT